MQEDFEAIMQEDFEAIMEEEEANLDPSLEEVIYVICNGDTTEDQDFSDHSNPLKSIVPGSQVEINEVNKMSSLLEVNFNNRDDLLAAVHKTASMEGFVTVIRRSKLDKSVFVGCDRGGNYRDTRMVSLEKRKRKTSSRLINCPFEIVGRRKPEGFWKR
uniref:uncharacterized protein LOC105350628 n=1 Tax=Fragaria vesca subsp. vesca TaxID=101020 RepID=UPI0005C8FCD7|nr:PREDICTED: uncharacterized protein LOC105350628 [Fragaria vesca subsp. vesca]